MLLKRVVQSKCEGMGSKFQNLQLASKLYMQVYTIFNIIYILKKYLLPVIWTPYSCIFERVARGYVGVAMSTYYKWQFCAPTINYGCPQSAGPSDLLTYKENVQAISAQAIRY